MKTIDSFTGEYGFLSNFWPAVVHLDGVAYPTVEHAFQAAKTTDPQQREEIRAAQHPGIAKRLGRAVQLRPNWEHEKLGVMRALLVEKFQDPELRELLLATGDAELVEGNDWGDTFWGRCRGVGANHLGYLLEQVRDEVRGAQ